jgi:hypothetical protein
VHPSELPSFDALATASSPVARSHVPRVIALVMLALLVVGGSVLMANRSDIPPGDSPAHWGATLADLPAAARVAAGDTVDLTVRAGARVSNLAALVLPHDLAVTTTDISATATIRGTSARRRDFPVTLVGRDNVMGFSIVKLGATMKPASLGPLPASTAVIAVAPVLHGSSTTPRYDWSATTLGDPTNDAQGVVHYLATKTNSHLAKYVDALAIDQRGRVVAILSAKQQWYSARFVAQVAEVLAVGHGCHADLGIVGADEQGGGVLVRSLQRYGAAAHAHLLSGDVITWWNGVQVDTWDQLRSMLYLTPVFTHARVTFLRGSKVHHVSVTLACPSKLES